MFRTLSATWNDPFHPRRNIPKSFKARAYGTRLQELDRTKAVPGKLTRSAYFTSGKEKSEIEQEVRTSQSRRRVHHLIAQAMARTAA